MSLFEKCFNHQNLIKCSEILKMHCFGCWTVFAFWWCENVLWKIKIKSEIKPILYGNVDRCKYRLNKHAAAAYMELVEFQELDKRIEEIYHESLDLQKCINDINSRSNKTFNWSTRYMESREIRCKLRK